ncbi:MAG: hypothetical protein K2K40_08130 [Paramuribaculum sp.]|nr:hypothetical protein [Paramuribaculum sp.]
MINAGLLTDIGVDCAGIIAAGVDTSSRLAVGTESGLALSYNHGHLDDSYNLVRYDDCLRVMSRHFPPSVVVSDSHPGLASTRVARALSRRTGARLVTVDHAHAHIAAVMADNGLRSRVIGLVTDLGDISTDNDSRHMRGTELLVCDLRSCTPVATAEAVAVPKSAEPWECAVGVILHYTGSLHNIPQGLLEAVGRRNITAAARRCDDPSESIVITGGRALADGAAAVIGTLRGISDGTLWHWTDIAALAEGLVAAPYSIDASRPFSGFLALEEMLADLHSHTDPSVVAARFFATLTRSWAVAACRIGAREEIDRVVASGDMMSSPYVCALLGRYLRALGMELYLPATVGFGDSSIAVGQAAVAAALRA